LTVNSPPQAPPQKKQYTGSDQTQLYCKYLENDTARIHLEIEVLELKKENLKLRNEKLRIEIEKMKCD